MWPAGHNFYMPGLISLKDEMARIYRIAIVSLAVVNIVYTKLHQHFLHGHVYIES
jgi:hypothetical protein